MLPIPAGMDAHDALDTSPRQEGALVTLKREKVSHQRRRQVRAGKIVAFAPY